MVCWLTCFKGLCCVCTQVSGSVVSNWPLCEFWTCVLWFFWYTYLFLNFWDTRRWIKSKSTIRSIPTHHRQNPTESSWDTLTSFLYFRSSSAFAEVLNYRQPGIVHRRTIQKFVTNSWSDIFRAVNMSLRHFKPWLQVCVNTMDVFVSRLRMWSLPWLDLFVQNTTNRFVLSASSLWTTLFVVVSLPKTLKCL
jgi:hypothetical protein